MLSTAVESDNESPGPMVIDRNAQKLVVSEASGGIEYDAQWKMKTMCGVIEFDNSYKHHGDSATIRDTYVFRTYPKAEEYLKVVLVGKIEQTMEDNQWTEKDWRRP
jgi:hypothetical protein